MLGLNFTFNLQLIVHAPHAGQALDGVLSQRYRAAREMAGILPTGKSAADGAPLVSAPEAGQKPQQLAVPAPTVSVRP